MDDQKQNHPINKIPSKDGNLMNTHFPKSMIKSQEPAIIQFKRTSIIHSSRQTALNFVWIPNKKRSQISKINIK
jgi:hypothetical protein